MRLPLLLRSGFTLAALAAVLVAAYTPAPARRGPTPARPDSVWTWPERSENLQVLPDSTGPDELRAVMQSFTRGLGVRCSECHVGEGRDFRTWDFASDAKPHKDVARGMMRMTWAINRDLLPEALDAHDHGAPAGAPARPGPPAESAPAGGAVHVHGDGTRHVHAGQSTHADAADRATAEGAEPGVEPHAEPGPEPAPDHASMRVTCWTCHRGQSHPETAAPVAEPGTR